MPAVDIASMTQTVSNFFVGIYAGYENQLITLTMYTIAMVIYGIVIWHYYRHLSKRDIFKGKYEGGKGNYVLKYLILFPLVSVVWFLIISVFLFFLAKSNTVDSILLISITLVSAVRAAAYYNEDLSKDLAKMIPFALLGIFIVDSTFFSFDLVYQRIISFPEFIPLIGRYILFVFILETILRGLHGLIRKE